MQPTIESVYPSFVVQIDSAQLIGTREDCQRFGRMEEFFWIGPNGPVRLDCKPIFTAAKRACPLNVKVWGWLWRSAEASTESHVFVGVSDERRYPGGKGVVAVTFKLAEGKFVVDQRPL